MNITHTKAKWSLMGISIALGIVSAWAIDQHLYEKTAEIESRSNLEQLTLMVASRDLSRDSIIEEHDYVSKLFPVKWAPDDAITFEESATLVGKRLVTDLRAGQPLMNLHLQASDTPGMSTRLSAELKAVSITVDPSSAATGLIRGGDKVDLFVSFEHLGKRITVGLLNSVQVLGAGHLFESNGRTDNSAGSLGANITLAVSQADAVKLVAAREAGTISAVLSSTQDSTDLKNAHGYTADLATLLGLPKEHVSRTIPIMYGDRLSTDAADLLQEERYSDSKISSKTASIR